ncbi:hypothetical protein P3X46_018296 [Hevea brasiliensis]|uniref:Retrotransposon gag domain-containing protein n=1 Tax=Hevea brasiliensis TaxID=3981 RepID=A0ABQ9LU43_HEVBR|nr:hypothetical protein P3X46_018296 [Hevea brasiliensis]
MGGENKTRENEKLSALEERLRAIEGLNMYGSVDVASLRLVPNVVVPPKFKVPDFDKYTGNSDPHIHLATYIAKMSALTEDDRLLVHFFHESLSGAALRWYLQNLVQRDRESFKEYAQRWREKLIMVPDFSLNIFPDVLAVRTDTGHRNSRMYGVITGRVLQLFPSNLNFVLEIYLMQTVEGTTTLVLLHEENHISLVGEIPWLEPLRRKWRVMLHCSGEALGHERICSGSSEHLSASTGHVPTNGRLL